MSSSASAKLVATATRLFYERGIAATGVDTIVAESGVSKPTLYTYFRTKHRLIAAVLDRQHQERRTSLEAFLQHRSMLPPLERVLSVFDWVAAQQRSDWARGCPFVNASVELVASDDAEAREMIQRHKRWFRRSLADLASQAGAIAPSEIASQLHLLIEGANARMLAEADLAAIHAAKKAAEVLVGRACQPSSAKPRSRAPRRRSGAMSRKNNQSQGTRRC
jgi:AcrR family transcriptional regulator